MPEAVMRTIVVTALLDVSAVAYEPKVPYPCEGHYDVL